MSYRLVMHPYSGCGPIELIDDGEREECRRFAAKVIRRHRGVLEYPVTVLERGRKWELESDPEGGHLISDDEGILEIKEIPEPDEDSEDDDWVDDGLEECGYCGEYFHPYELTDGVCDDCLDDEDVADVSTED